MALTEAQILHNKLLDMEIESAEREFQMREEIARMKNKWFRETYPNSPFQSAFGMNMIGRKKVVGIRYVE